jgi:hypothetical protein
MPGARPNHALVDLAEKDDVRPMPRQDRGDRLDMAKALDVPDGDADRPVAPLAEWPCTAQLDFPERRNFGKTSLMAANIGWLVKHCLADRQVYLRDGSDPRLDRSADPLGEGPW